LTAGADNRPGLFELADRGTLFLDEIDSMSIELQAKLLRVLQDGCTRRIVDVNTVCVDVRVIAATSVNPLDAVKAGHLVVKTKCDMLYLMRRIIQKSEIILHIYVKQRLHYSEAVCTRYKV
jgi:DNA-binding NtrC family response regulator